MSFNLLDSVKGLFNSDLVSKMASSFGESEEGIQKAIGGGIPAVLTGLLNKAGTADGAASLLNLSKDAASSGIMGNLGNLLGGGNLLGKGMDMLKGLFGDKTNAITSMISNFAGIRESSASSLLSVAAPAALGTVGKQVTQSNMGVSGLTSWLAEQKDSILKAVPSGLNIAGALGLGSLSDLGNKLSGLVGGAAGNVKHVAGTASAFAHETADKAKGGAKWLWPLLLALLVILALIYFLRGKGKKEEMAATPPTEQTTPATDSMANVTPTTPIMESIKVKLPDGTELDAYKGGIEDRLVAFLNDPNSKGGKDVWFDFDNLNFKTGSAEITEESMVQVNNIAAILKAYPKLVIKIGGYTDKSGDEKVNMKLSQDRANAVHAALKGKGAAAKQLAGAEGYGSQFAKAAADAPDEERKKDRRIAVGVREK